MPHKRTLYIRIYVRRFIKISVRVKLLLFKLQLSVFPTLLFNWKTSYLQNKFFRVLFNSVSLNDSPATSGIPQSSHLGPFLIILYKNKLLLVIKSIYILMNAGHGKVFPFFNVGKYSRGLQSYLDNLTVWCSLNLMELKKKV